MDESVKMDADLGAESPARAPNRPDSLTRRQRIALWAILAVASIARLGYAGLWRQRALSWDSAGYDEAARRLLERGYFAYGSGVLGAHSNAFTMPGYTYFLAAVYAVFGRGDSGLLAARVIQALAGVAVVVLVFLIGRRVAGNTAGLVAAGLAAVYPALIIMSGDIMTEAVYVLLLMLEVWVALNCVDNPNAANFLLLGLLAGLGALVRPVGILWAAAPVVILLVRRSASLAKLARWGAVTAGVAMLVMSPWWIRNWTIYHEFVPFNTSSANPLLVSSYWPDPPPPVASVWPYAVSDNEKAMNAQWQRLALARLGSRLEADPLGFAVNRAVMGFESAVEPGTVVAVRWRPPNWAERLADLISQIMQPLLVILAGIGIWVRRRSMQVLLLASLPLYVTAMGLITLGLPRYVLPATPVGCVLAALGILWIAERVSVLRSSTREPA